MKDKGPKYSLQHLAELSGLEPRTIRWYISQGLLMGPESRGPKAYYTEQHRRRLETIRELKEVYNVPISEIRRFVAMAGDEDIRIHPIKGTAAFPAFESSPQGFNDPLAAQSNKAMPSDDDDCDALYQECLLGDEASHSLKSEMSPLRRRAMWAARGIPPYQTMANEPYPNLNRRLAGPASPLAKLLRLLKDVLGPRQVRRQSRGVNWVEVEVTPDIVLRLRGDFDLHQLDLLGQLADHLRAYILGGGEMPGPEKPLRDGDGGPG